MSAHAFNLKKPKLGPVQVAVATLIAVAFVLLASSAAQAWDRRYHNDFNYANAVRGSGPIANITGGKTYVGYSSFPGYSTNSYGGTYNYYNGTLYAYGAASGDSWSNYGHAVYNGGESKCWWNTSYPYASHNPLLICDQKIA